MTAIVKLHLKSGTEFTHEIPKTGVIFEISETYKVCFKTVTRGGEERLRSLADFFSQYSDDIETWEIILPFTSLIFDYKANVVYTVRLDEYTDDINVIEQVAIEI